MTTGTTARVLSPALHCAIITPKYDKYLVSWCYLFPYGGRANSRQPKTRLITEGVAAGGLSAQPLVPWECFQSIHLRCEGAASAVAVAVCGGGPQDCGAPQTSCLSGCCGCSGASVCSSKLCWKCLSFFTIWLDRKMAVRAGLKNNKTKTKKPKTQNKKTHNQTTPQETDIMKGETGIKLLS